MTQETLIILFDLTGTFAFATAKEIPLGPCADFYATAALLGAVVRPSPLRGSFVPRRFLRVFLTTFFLRTVAIDPYPLLHPRSGRRGRDILRFPGASGIFGAGGGGSAGAVLLTGCAQSLSIPSRVVVSVYQRVSPGEGSGPVEEMAPGDVVTARVQGPVAEGPVNIFTTILARSVSAIGAPLV